MIVSSGGTAYVALRPLLADYTLSMTRGAAVVYPKDAGADPGPGRHLRRRPGASRPGPGSGALSCWLLRAVGESGLLVSYERRADFAEIARANVERYFGGPHPSWRLVTGELPAEGAAAAWPDGEAFDRVVLDMLAPWEYARRLRAVAAAGRPGLLLRGHHHAAVAHRGGAARAGQLRRARRVGIAAARLACRRARRPPRAPYGGAHRVPGHRPAARGRGNAAAAAAPAVQGRTRRPGRRRRGADDRRCRSGEDHREGREAAARPRCSRIVTGESRAGARRRLRKLPR